MSVFGDRLQKYMIDNDMYPTEVQKLTGVHRTRVNSYIYYGGTPRIEALTKICRGLGVSADYFLGLKEKYS